ncbi:MAG: LLM class flavin-dependent oxidoreductase [Candidatus Rokubacteria bacterium]|nr:LLM class flavin-dependent oxidoreductase [Candidatus Rokubacteria bacterium]
MRFGLLIANQHPPAHDPVQRFAETTEQVRVARDLGFDPVVFGQHFLSTEFSRS